MFDTHDAAEQHDADTDERQRGAADASAQRWTVAAARVRDIDTVLRHCAPALDGIAPGISQPQRVTAVRRAISGAMNAAQPNKARRAFAESTVPDHAIPPPPARLGPSDDHASPALASQSAWRTWTRSVRDLRPAWAAAQTGASADIRDAADPRDVTVDIDTAIITAARLRDLVTVLRLCASAIRGVPPAILTPRDITAVRRAIVGTSFILRRQRAGSHCPPLAIPHPPAQLGPSGADYDPTPGPDATAEAWSDWANYIQALRPGWISIRLRATAHADTERADDRAHKLTRMYFDDRSAAHAMMRDNTCTTSPSL